VRYKRYAQTTCNEFGLLTSLFHVKLMHGLRFNTYRVRCTGGQAASSTWCFPCAFAESCTSTSSSAGTSPRWTRPTSPADRGRPARAARARHSAPRHQAGEHPLRGTKLNLFLETGETYKEQLRGTIGYMSPELILTGGLHVCVYAYVCDHCVFSACLVLECSY
jgi:hypothetical protein